ncbi:hypothetical protein F4775DRAFT_296738 [Biscogniauxia sp. FL1348]|nr:hypothetical protein F4775DRAFT_296738 [Biscogniauxia sp. FL1348]
MSSSGSQRPPPLPPRSPRPGSDVPLSPYEHRTWNFPPPPPGPPPRNLGLSPSMSSPPPPIPPRPPGFEINTSMYGNNASSRPQSVTYMPLSPSGQASMGHQLPPPGPGSTVSTYTPPLPPRPQQQQQNIPAATSHYTPAVQSSWSTGGQLPNGLTTFPPPPPPGPPPRSPNVYNVSVAPPYEPALPAPGSIHFGPHNPAPLPEHAVHQTPTPDSPPPAYTPLNESPEAQPTPASSVYYSPAAEAPSSRYSSPPVSDQPSPDVLITSFQSLDVGSASAVPPASHMSPRTNSTPYTERVAYSVPPPPPPPPSSSPPATDEQPPRGISQQSHTEAHTTLKQAPFAVTSCIDAPITFETDWYQHPEAPDFPVCSRCYVDHIYGTRFQNAFRRERPSDGKPRHCRFGKPRMQDYLFKDAVKSGSLQAVLEWMRFRSLVPDCKGVGGVKGDVGIKWYSPRSNAIPGFVSCQACYEDRLVNNQFATMFEPWGPQPASETWACDVAIPFIQNEYEARGKHNDWIGFVTEAKARMSGSPCPQRQQVATHGKNWFVPVAGPEGLVLCAACYCDQIIHTGEEPKWAISTDLRQSTKHRASCVMGMVSIKLAMACAHDAKDFSVFWTAVAKIGREKPCADGGIAGGTWYTLPSDPAEFGICGACHAGIIEPLGVSRFFVRKRFPPDHDPNTALLCSLSPAHPRAPRYLPLLLEAYYTRAAPRALAAYAADYAAVPLCPRDTPVAGRRWYGWDECAVCPECYVSFARGAGGLAAHMTLRDAARAGETMCELYSARMRGLYTECGASSPPDPQPLLEHAAHRRAVWAETVVPIRAMLREQRAALERQRFLNVMSSHYTAVGGMRQVAYGYGAPGVGYGFANMEMLQGAAYGNEARAATAGVGGAVATVQILERRWRAVE